MAPTAYADGDCTAGFFFPYSRTGQPARCHTGETGQPIGEHCFTSDPLATAMGVGMQIAAGYVNFDNFDGTTVWVRTNNRNKTP